MTTYSLGVSTIANLPLWVRKFILDFFETGVAALLGLQLAFPTNTIEARQVVLSVVIALSGAFVSAIRRAAPSISDWVKSKLGL